MKRPIPRRDCEDCDGGTFTDYNYNGPYEARCTTCDGSGEFEVETCDHCGARSELMDANGDCYACMVALEFCQDSPFHHPSREREIAQRIADVINSDWTKPQATEDRSQRILAALNLKGN